MTARRGEGYYDVFVALLYRDARMNLYMLTGNEIWFLVDQNDIEYIGWRK